MKTWHRESKRMESVISDAAFCWRSHFTGKNIFHNKALFPFLRYNDGTVKLRNPNIELMDQDILYHLALGSGSHDLEEMFGDVKVSCGVERRVPERWHLFLSVSVCLHGRHSKEDGELCTLYHGWDRLQVACRYTVARHQRFLVSLLDVQGRKINGRCDFELSHATSFNLLRFLTQWHDFRSHRTNSECVEAVESFFLIFSFVGFECSRKKTCLQVSSQANILK